MYLEGNVFHVPGKGTLPFERESYYPLTTKFRFPSSARNVISRLKKSAFGAVSILMKILVMTNF